MDDTISTKYRHKGIKETDYIQQNPVYEHRMGKQ